MSSSEARERWRTKRTTMIEHFCVANGFKLEALNHGYQLRIEDSFDFYPTNGKWHFLPTGERGDWHTETDLKLVILEMLKPELAIERDTRNAFVEFLEGDAELKQLYMQDATVHACFKQGEYSHSSLETTLTTLVKMLAKEKKQYADLYQQTMTYNVHPTMILQKGLIPITEPTLWRKLTRWVKGYRKHGS